MANVVDLGKKVQVVLEKKALTGVRAEIKVATDTSGSMETTFRKGTVQKVIERLLAVGMKMDVNQSIEVYGFNTSSQYVGEANVGNHANFVNDVFLKKTRVGGGTNYAPVMKQIINDVGAEGTVTEEIPAKGFLGKLFGKTETVVKETVVETQAYPTLVFFVTDGDNFDKAEARQVIKEASNQGIFWQFIGIGNDSFRFLEELDDMEGRFVDNANFFQVNDIDRISDEELYERLLNEFPLWLKEARAKDLVN